MNSIFVLFIVAALGQVGCLQQSEIDPTHQKFSNSWKNDTLGYNGSRSEIIEMDTFWSKFNGIDSSQVLLILGNPDYVCNDSDYKEYIYCFENWRGGSPNTKSNYISRRDCSENQSNWSYIVIRINSVGLVSEKPSILWRG